MTIWIFFSGSDISTVTWLHDSKSEIPGSENSPQCYVAAWMEGEFGKNWWFSHKVMSDSVTPQIVAHQAPLSKGFPRQEYWSGLPFPPPGDPPNPGVESVSPSFHAVSWIRSVFLKEWGTRKSWWGRMDTCICLAESLCYPPETITALIYYTPTLNNRFLSFFFLNNRFLKSSKINIKLHPTSSWDGQEVHFALCICGR